MQKRNLKKTFSFFVVIFLFIFGSLLMIAGCTSSDSDNDGAQDHNAMLAALGVNTDIGERKNPAGDPVPADYNPTLKKVTQPAKRSEIFIAGTQGQDESASWTTQGQFHAVLDWADGASDFSSANMSGDDSWLKHPKTMASGDMDGDGVDEIIVAYLTPSTAPGYEKELALKVIKNINGAYEIKTTNTVKSYPSGSIIYYPTPYFEMNNFNAVCGDVDGNGQSETLIAFNGSIFLIGDSLKGYGVLQSINYPKSDDISSIVLKISSGDLDNNGTDEFVVVENDLKSDVLYGTSKYHIYAGLTLDELDSDTIALTDGATTYTLHSSNCAVGDLDADGLNEILFIGEREDSKAYWMFVLEQNWNETLGKFEFSFNPRYGYMVGRNEWYLTPICAIADFDGDGKKDIIGYRYMFENLSDTGGTFKQKQSTGDLYDPVNVVIAAGTLGSVWDCSLAVGDFDGDLKADICYISDGFYELYCLGFNSAGEWVRKGTGDIMDSGAYYPYVTMGDFDGDSIVVEFEDSETLFSDPHPIAVLVANPSWKGVDMDGKTSFGSTMGNSVENEKSIGFSIGYSIGYEAKGFYSGSVKVSLEQFFDWTATKSLSIEESYTYTTINEDKVIFTTVPYDVYYYRVIQAPDPDLIDTMITINLPRKPITLPVERRFYNDNNGEAPDIDDTILTHSIGEPFSYPTIDVAEDLISSGGGQGVKSTKMMTVGQGTGSTAIAMSIKESTGSGRAFDFSVNIEAEAGYGGFTMGGNTGFHYGEKYTITTSEGMLYGGEINNIPNSDWNSNRSFSWGLFSYKATLYDENFIVVQYYTGK